MALQGASPYPSVVLGQIFSAFGLVPSFRVPAVVTTSLAEPLAFFFGAAFGVQGPIEIQKKRVLTRPLS